MPEEGKTECCSDELVLDRIACCGTARVHIDLIVGGAQLPLHRARTEDRVVAALSLCMGIEALVLLQDVCGLEAVEAVEVSRWAAQALLQAGLREATASSPPPGAPSHQEPDQEEDEGTGRSTSL